jgi:biotin carboxylase
MVERFMPGPQVSTESLVIDGIAHTPGFADRNYELLERYAPHIIENGGQLPSHLPPHTQQAVRDLVQQAAQSMGIRNGVVKGDIVVSDGKPHVIELAARLSGGYFCTHEIPLNTGVDLVGAAIRQALGEPVEPADLQPRFNRPVAQRYLLPGAGRLRAISGIEEAKAVGGVEELLVTAKPGDLLRDPVDSNCSAAMVIATGATREEAIASAMRAIGHLHVEMMPL